MCGFAVFDFTRFGNSKYGSPLECQRHYRSRQGKMEKSYLNFLHSHRQHPGGTQQHPCSPGLTEAADEFLTRLGAIRSTESHFGSHMSAQVRLPSMFGLSCCRLLSQWLFDSAASGD